MVLFAVHKHPLLPSCYAVFALQGFLSFTCSPDSEAMGFLLQITMSCPCALSRKVVGAGRRCWCCELAVHVVETGCWVLVPVLGAGCRCWCRAGAGHRCWCRVPVLVLVLVLGAGCRCWCWCREPVLVLGAGAGGVACICEGIYFRIFFPKALRRALPENPLNTDTSPLTLHHLHFDTHIYTRTHTGRAKASKCEVCQCQSMQV